GTRATCAANNSATVSPGAASPGTVTPGAVGPGTVRPGTVRPGTVTPGAVRPGTVSPAAAAPVPFQSSSTRRRSPAPSTSIAASGVSGASSSAVTRLPRQVCTRAPVCAAISAVTASTDTVKPV